MPELPEVETSRRLLDPFVVGRTVVSVEVNRGRVLRRQERDADFAGRLTGRRVRGTRRLGKHLMIDLDDDLTWVIHLGMSGRLAIAADGAEPPPHTHVQIRLDDDTEIWFTDPRTFGYTVAYTPEEFDRSPTSRLGSDALTDLPDATRLASLLERRTAPIKALLLDQSLIAGIGNIYADEALHGAAIDPFRQGGTLESGELGRLVTAISVTLDMALASGGTSLDDLAYLLPDGRTGDYLERLQVYGREGEPCLRCGAPVRRSVIRGRSTFWCSECQS